MVVIAYYFDMFTLAGVEPTNTLSRMNKDTGMRIRVERGFPESILDRCRTQDHPAVQLLREFMREYARKHQSLQPDTEQDNALGPSIRKTADG